MTKSRGLLHDGRTGVGGFFFVGMDFAVIFGVEGAVFGVEMLGRHGEDEAVFLAAEAGAVVATVGIDHAFGEGSGVDELGERRGKVAVLLLEVVLGAEDDAHVAEGGRFGIGAGGISGELWLVGRDRSLGGESRRREHGGRREYEAGDDGKKTSEIIPHAESSPRAAQQELSRGFALQKGSSTFFFMLLR